MRSIDREAVIGGQVEQIRSDGRWAGPDPLAVDDPPDHPHAVEVRNRTKDKRSRYLRGYGGVLGFGYPQLVAI